MKIIHIVVALSVMGCSGSALAANTEFKSQGSKSQGNCNGYFASLLTGNGGVVSGNGTIGGQPLPSTGVFPSDQTTYPGSRADEVRVAKATPCPPN